MKNLPKINPSKALKASLPYLIAGLLCTKLGDCHWCRCRRVGRYQPYGRLRRG